MEVELLKLKIENNYMISQKFFYPLYYDFDKKFFNKLNKGVKEKQSLVGSGEDKIFFIKSLFYYQLINKEYRKSLEIIHDNLTPKTDIKKINKLIKTIEFKEDLSWVNWLNEKEMIKLVKKFWRHKKIKIIGTNKQFDEFVLRYLISVWLVDWGAPLFALLQSTKDGIINLKECNQILSFWDFTKIF